MSSAPPHPGAAWQECQDNSTGFPYFWNTVTNEVRWECPREFSQYRGRPVGPGQVSLPPPGLVTNISLAQPQPVTRGRSREATPTSTAPLSVTTSVKSSLVSGYDSDDSDSDNNEDDSSHNNGKKPSDPNELKEDFIGPVVPSKEKKAEPVKSRSNSKECDDILSLIEAENPPDYVETKPLILPSTAKKESSKPKGSILQLASNYDDSDQGESDDNSLENGEKKNLTQLDNYGRLVFGENSESNSDRQTEEQRKALEMYKIEESKNKKNTSAEVKTHTNRIDNSISTSRKRRLDLPRGKFNKADNIEASDSNGAENSASLNFVPFVKSSTGLPGTIETSSEAEEVKENIDQQKENQCNEEIKQPEEPFSEDVGELTTELVEKMEHFNVGQEKISTMKTIAIKLEALYSAWAAGELSLIYFKTFLKNSFKKVVEAEQTLSRPPWKAVWDRRQKLYKYINQDDGRESLTSASPPPATPPLPQDPAPPPPPEPKEPPATPSPPPLPTSGADHEPQDMEIDEEGDKEDGEGITDQLSQFYSEIEVAPEPESREETPDTQTEDDNASVPDESAPSLQSSEPSSPQQPDSPLPNQPRKRKKVKVSNNLSLKKKGVGSMLAKWQKMSN